VLVIGLAAVFLYVWLSNRQVESGKASAVAAPVKSIAVLPFKTMSAEKDDEFLGLGVTDTLINSLSRTRQFVVRQMSAVLKYTDQDKDPLAAGSEQGVEAVLAGRIHRVGNRVRVTAQLVRVSDGASLWADRFDEQYTHIFAVEDAIAEKVALAMTRSLAAANKPITTRPTDNSEAYQAYLKGQYFLSKRTGEGLKKGIESFEQAIARDPNFAAAYAGLSDCLALLNIYDALPPRDAFEKARVAATTALVLDDNLAEAHASLGLILMYHDWDWLTAEREYVRAIALNPDYPIVHQWRALNLAAQGRLDEARTEIKRAQELDPPSLIINTNVGWIAYLSGQYDQAIDQFKKTVELDPKFSRTRVRMGIVYAQKKMYPEAKAEFRQALNLSAGNPYALSLLGYASALSADRAEAQRILTTLKAQSDQNRITTFGIGLIYTGLGEPEQALAWLEKALEQHPDSMIFLKVDPAFNSLRTHPKFLDLLRRMRLAN
ncbi:MAG: tetratricopeptide repeat protein, partial [Acidobacteriota bacterium]